MKDRIERYEIRCTGNLDPIARVIEDIGGTIYEVNRAGIIRAGLSSLQRSDLEEKRLGITIDGQTSF